MDFLPDNLLGYAEVAMAVIAIASVAAAGLAKLTKTDKDDKLAQFLVKLHDFLARLGFHPSMGVKKAALLEKPGVTVHDHRNK